MLAAGSAVYKKQRPTIRRADTREIVDNFHPSQGTSSHSTTASSNASSATVQMTPAQRMKAKKIAEADARAEELHRAAQGAKGNYDQARARRTEQSFENIMKQVGGGS